MPIIATVDGIRVAMFSNDHAPPHFHAWLAEHMFKVEIEDARVVGRRPPGAMERKIVKWTKAHRPELMDAWNAMRMTGKPRKIP